MCRVPFYVFSKYLFLQSFLKIFFENKKVLILKRTGEVKHVAIFVLHFSENTNEAAPRRCTLCCTFVLFCITCFRVL